MACRARRTAEPKCRCCGCTQNNACEGGCEWVRVPVGEPPLCSACSGTSKDVLECVRRALRYHRDRHYFSIAATLRPLLKRVRDHDASDTRDFDHG